VGGDGGREGGRELSLEREGESCSSRRVISLHSATFGEECSRSCSSRFYESDETSLASTSGVPAGRSHAARVCCDRRQEFGEGYRSLAELVTPYLTGRRARPARAN